MELFLVYRRGKRVIALMGPELILKRNVIGDTFSSQPNPEEVSYPRIEPIETGAPSARLCAIG